VAIDFGMPDQRDLDTLDLATARRYLAEGQFGAGSMRPKVEAAVRFAASAPGRRAVICSLEGGRRMSVSAGQHRRIGRAVSR
jgi:carbamate kinase